MRPSIRPRASRYGLLAAAGLTLAVGASPLLVSGADHLDAPAAKADHRVDITDVYAFRSTSSTTTLVLNVDGLMSPADSKTATFRSNALYELKLDRNQDGTADMAYRVRFGDPIRKSDGTRTQNYVVRRAVGSDAVANIWSGSVVATGRTTPYKHSARIAGIAGGGSAFAGVRDDPFFFDLPGFVEFKEQLLGGSTDLGELLGGFTAADTFAGTNVLSIALKLPNAKLGGTGNSIGVWAATSTRSNGGWRQIDRMGRPAINTVFNGTHLPLSSTLNNAEKEGFNHVNPTSDRRITTDNVVAVMGVINNVLDTNGADTWTDDEIAGLAKVLLPDVLTVKLGDPSGFLNGRRLGDDVIDAEFSLLTKGAIPSDGVDANDKSFSATFPYLARPH
jgi:uncharacterized protein DUF4331